MRSENTPPNRKSQSFAEGLFDEESKASSSDNRENKTSSRAESSDGLEKADAENTSSENSSPKQDKIEEDYQSRRRGNSIWGGQREKFYENYRRERDPQSYESETDRDSDQNTDQDKEEGGQETGQGEEGYYPRRRYTRRTGWRNDNQEGSETGDSSAPEGYVPRQSNWRQGNYRNNDRPYRSYDRGPGQYEQNQDSENKDGAERPDSQRFDRNRSDRYENRRPYRPNGYQGRPGYNQDRPGYNQDRPGYNQDRPGYNQDRPGYNQDRPGYQNRPGYNQDRQGYNQDRPGYQNRGYQGRPGYQNRYNSGYNQDRPGYQNRGYQNRPGYNQGYNQDRPGYNQNTGFNQQNASQNPPANSEIPQTTGENDQKPENTERPAYQQERPYREYLEPTLGARGRHGEPISLAEELALERYQPPAEKEPESDSSDNKEKQSLIAELQNLSMLELVQEARKDDVETIDGETRHDLVFRILKERIRKNGLMFGEGTLEILPDEFGFLRSPDFNYISCPDDIYISPSQIRRFGLRNGLTISGQIRPPKERERYFALLRIEAINHEDPNMLSEKPYFDDLTAMHPNQRIIMETDDGDINTRVLDLIVPVGFGQRGLIVSPPRAGKTILMQKMARAVLKNYPDSYVFMLLVDERPEEVTDMEREVKGPHCEVVSSTFDEPSARHIQVSEMVLEKAKRMVEYGKDVVIFLDSITRLARAWNSECPDSGKTLTGGVDSNALQRPKKFFGSARKVEEGGSLTIIATALIGTGSRMDDVIFEEFKGTGNLEIRLDRSLVDRRTWPAIDITQSGTRREEMILDHEECLLMAELRKILVTMNPVDAMEYLTERLGRTKKNVEFLMGLKH